MKIVVKNSFEVSKEEMDIILNKAKNMYGKSDSEIIDSQVFNTDLQILSNSKYEEFSKKECDLIREILVYPNFKISTENPILYAEGKNGYAYILGKNLKF